MNRIAGSVLLVLLVLLAGGCAMGPDYKRPVVETPEQFRVSAGTAAEVANTAWWQQFNDEQMNTLVQRALANNLDLAIASARVEEYFGRYGVQRSQLFPQIGAGAQAGKQLASEAAWPGISSGVNPKSNAYLVNLGATWEIDLFGRLRRATEAARADVLATEEGWRGTILSLVSAVATSYINLIDLDQQLEIARETVRAREASKRIFELRFEGGAVSQVELYQARADYETALATIPTIERAIAQEENNLSVLIGRNPGTIARGRRLDALPMIEVPAGLPSELLERRPDLRQAEQNLVAANARIGVAKAAFFPVISLTGILGSASASLSDLFTGPARTWSYGAAISQPIFAGGFFTSQLAVAEAQQKQALAAYQRAIQNAFREVNDALIEQQKLREQLEAQQRQVEALRGYAQLARLRYENGYTSYLEVTDAETRLFNAELQYTQARGELYLALISTYKAMGGGWINVAAQSAPQPGAPEKPAPAAAKSAPAQPASAPAKP